MENLKLIAIDETRYWDDDTQKIAGTIYTVYLYNPNSVTHCCELTPSYCMYEVGVFPINTPEDDDECESFLDLMTENSNFDAIYMHCSDVKSYEQYDTGFPPFNPEEDSGEEDDYIQDIITDEINANGIAENFAFHVYNSKII